MTHDEAVKVWLEFGTSRIHAYNSRFMPQHIADKAMILNAEDCIDGLIALGLLKVEQPAPSSPSTDGGNG